MKKFILYFVSTLIIIFIATLFIGYSEEFGKGMEPTIKDKATMLIFKPTFFPIKYKVGDVVIYKKDPGFEYTGRILATPGQRINIHEGMLFIDENGKIEQLHEDAYNSERQVPIHTNMDDEWITLTGYLIYLDKSRNQSSLYEHVISPEKIMGKIYFVFQ